MWFSSEDWQKTFDRKARPVFKQYLQDIVSKTAIRGRQKPSRQEVEKLVNSIEHLIMPFGWGGSDHDFETLIYQLGNGTDREIAARLQYYVDQFASFPELPYALVGYEAMTRGGVYEDLVFHLNYIVARLLHEHAPVSYDMIERMFNGLGPLTLYYIKRLEGYKNSESVLMRHRLDIIGVLYYMAMPSNDLWPNKRQEVCSWAKSYLEVINRWAEGIDVNSSLSYWSGHYLSNLNR